MSLEFNIRIADKSSDFVKRLLTEQWLPILDKAINKAKDNIQSRSKDFLSRLVIDSDTYKSLSGGELQQHFGLRPTEVATKLNQIVRTLGESVQVTTTPLVYNKRIRGGLSISAFNSSFSDLLTGSEGIVTTNKGQDLPWLDWLLTKGDRIIISDYFILFGADPKSRAGEALMVQSQGSFWRVPPKFAGTVDDNWITRICEDQSNIINKELTHIITSELENVL